MALAAAGCKGNKAAAPTMQALPVKTAVISMQSVAEGVGAAGGEVQVTIINNAPNTQVSQRENTGPSGQRSLEVIIDEAVANQLSRGGSASSRAMRNIYGTSQTLTGR